MLKLMQKKKVVIGITLVAAILAAVYLSLPLLSPLISSLVAPQPAALQVRAWTDNTVYSYLARDISGCRDGGTVILGTFANVTYSDGTVLTSGNLEKTYYYANGSILGNSSMFYYDPERKLWMGADHFSCLPAGSYQIEVRASDGAMHASALTSIFTVG